MSKNSLPGFTAETSLSPTATFYHAKSIHSLYPAGRTVAPQLPPGGCGQCTALTWPDGRPTGVCVQDCCDALGTCTSQRCACGGGGVGVFGVGSTLGFLM
jgi:hypothetical protein